MRRHADQALASTAAAKALVAYMEAKRFDEERDSCSSHEHLTPAAASQSKRGFLGALLAWMGIDGSRYVSDDIESPATRSTGIDAFQIADSSTRLQRLPQPQRLAQPEPLAMPEPSALDGTALTTASRPARAVHFAPMTGVESCSADRTSLSSESSASTAWRRSSLALQGNMSVLGALDAPDPPKRHASRPAEVALPPTRSSQPLQLSLPLFMGTLPLGARFTGFAAAW